MGPTDFVRNARKGNDSKSKGKAIILKRPLPVAKVYGVLWLPLGSCGALESRPEEIDSPTPAGGEVNRIQCDDRLAL